MKKIAFYIDKLYGGGAERVMSQLASQFAEHGYESLLITHSKNQNEYEVNDKVRRLFLEKRRNANPLIRNIERIYNLRKICKEEKPDILLAFLNQPCFRAILAGIGLEHKTIISVRSNPNTSLSSGFYKFIGKYIFPHVDGCVFQTEEAKKWFPKKLQEKSTIILNQVGESFFDIQRECQETCNCVAVGSLTAPKNYETLVRAFQMVCRRFPQSKLHIYGEGKEREKIERLIHELQLDDHVFLMGRTHDIGEVLRKAGIYILSSETEGMPNALMEAMAVGVPCVSTDCPCGGPRMLIQDGESGLLVPVKNEELLGDTICYLLRNPNYAEKLGIVAKEQAKKFSPEFIFKQWENYFQERCKKDNVSC